LRRGIGAVAGSPRFNALMMPMRIKAVIPPKSTRKVKRVCDFALYAERNLVERFFNAIKQYRGIATRYEKTARNFLAGLHLVCALAWLK
jgi:transposase